MWDRHLLEQTAADTKHVLWKSHYVAVKTLELEAKCRSNAPLWASFQEGLDGRKRVKLYDVTYTAACDWNWICVRLQQLSCRAGSPAFMTCFASLPSFYHFDFGVIYQLSKSLNAILIIFINIVYQTTVLFPLRMETFFSVEDLILETKFLASSTTKWCVFQPWQLIYNLNE